MAASKESTVTVMVLSLLFLLGVINVTAAEHDDRTTSSHNQVVDHNKLSNKSTVVMNRNKEEEDGAKVMRVENLNNPYKKQSNFDWRFMLTMNKIYVWSLVEYERVVMLDSDNIFLQNTDELFQCGQFCAVFINPCIFHTGLFVLQPSMQVFKDMVRGLENERENPDGADQGFIGSYFPDLLDRPMFHPPSNPTTLLNGTFRLPLGYQMDASYYYLKLRWSVPCGPNSVITFPSAPWLKPWYWWSWPVLPLGISWHERRRQTLGYGEEMGAVLLQAGMYVGLIAVTRVSRGNMSKLWYRGVRVDKTNPFIQMGLKLLAVWSIIAAYAVPFFLIPCTIHPLIGWTLYLLASFALSSVSINAFLLPTLPILTPWLAIFGALFVMAFPWYPDGIVRAISVFGYAFLCAPFLWASIVRVRICLTNSFEKDLFFTRLGDSTTTTSPSGINKLC
ncbi:hypothetical protein F8388_016929 [Cannabis sativa]|uniref:Uncharacterized protein n=1 Tax=Cannabis sativa TaxID=3483 RepID=A0A7J6E3Z7_CANSA|nr:hypothetical protein F8388_016929 [Cannabis sativa]